MRGSADGNYTHYAEPLHATDAVTAEAIRVFNSHKYKQGILQTNFVVKYNSHYLLADMGSTDPLFLYLAYHAGHGPLLPHPRHATKCKHLQHEWRRDYCGLVVGLGTCAYLM